MDPMRTPTVIPQRGRRRERFAKLGPSGAGRPKINATTAPASPTTTALKHYPRPYQHQTSNGRVKSQIRRAINPYIRRAFTPLIDAKAASTLLGVPYTWLLAQARAGNIPHHRLGHYVRFDPDDLQTWLREERIEPYGPGRRVR
jgi:excisionase family DNA binding protein